MKFNYKIKILSLFFLFSLVSIAGCKKFLEVPLPTDKFAADGAYISDNSAAAVLTGILSTAANSSVYGSSLNYESIGFRTGLYADDLTLIQLATANTTATVHAAYYLDALSSANSTQWIALYKQIYNCNLALEGVTKNKDRLPKANQWLGEALFLRAFSFFDLINLYGDVPLTTTSNYVVNNVMSRTSKDLVYKQIIDDLKEAEGYLGTTYLDGIGATTANRTRPNKYVVNALLSRVYLYTGDWVNAEAQASKVIESTTNFELLAPASVFLANSRETIWALAPPTTTAVRDYYIYNNGAPASTTTQATLATFSPAAMSQSLLNTFEPNDVRFTSWVRSSTTTTTPAGGIFYFPNKYKSTVNGTEFNIVLRLGEQYLIRAEARARHNDVPGAVQDLNALRLRARPATPAGVLPDYPSTISQLACIDAVMKERRVELFSEFGHRFYDLKRTGAIDAVMTAAAVEKGTTWASWKQIWPIPLNDPIVNPNLTQAPNYQ